MATIVVVEDEEGGEGEAEAEAEAEAGVHQHNLAGMVQTAIVGQVTIGLAGVAVVAEEVGTVVVSHKFIIYVFLLYYSSSN